MRWVTRRASAREGGGGVREEEEGWGRTLVHYSTDVRL